VYESTGLDKGKPLKKSLIQLQPARDLNPEPPEFEPDALIYASTVLGILKTSYVQGIYVQGAGTQEKPYYAHSARVAGWSQVLNRWEKPGAFAVSDRPN
jgi:hypothetical protein